MGDLKLYACPLTTITKLTWDILDLVNQTTDDKGKIIHMPYKGAYLEQPEWYRDAVKLTQRERANDLKIKLKNAENNKKKG